MSQTHPQPAEADPIAPLRGAFQALLAYGRDLLGRIQGAIAHADTSRLPKRLARAPLTAEQRIARTLDWIVALARTLAGDRTWLIVPTYNAPRLSARYPSLTADLRREIGLPAIPPRTEVQKAAAHLRYVKKVFATQPVARIAARLARRLGIPETSDFWPTALVAITETPVAWARRAAAPAKAAPSDPQPIAAPREPPNEPPKIPTTGPPAW